MLSCFNLKRDVTVQEFEGALLRFTNQMQELGLVQSTGPIGERQNDTPMDTDTEREHRYFFITTFQSREQCDRAYAYIKLHEEPGAADHDAVYSRVESPIFICWQDI